MQRRGEKTYLWSAASEDEDAAPEDEDEVEGGRCYSSFLFLLFSFVLFLFSTTSIFFLRPPVFVSCFPSFSRPSVLIDPCFPFFFSATFNIKKMMPASGLLPFLVLCPIFSVQDGDNGGKSIRCCWLMDQTFPWFGFSPFLYVLDCPFVCLFGGKGGRWCNQSRG